ncbi:MAG: hypothetical protein AB7O96_15800 [Pseudobdellovibrionaceae bacterium]
MDRNANSAAKFETPAKTKIYRFDVFRGTLREDGKIEKASSVGHATLYEGSATYTIYLKMFLKDQFFLLPEREIGKPYDFVILTREPSSLPGKRFFWNRIGTAKCLSDQNAGIMELDFDLFQCVGLYLNFHESTVKEQEFPAA